MHCRAGAGPCTAIGLARSRRARWKHGLYSAEALAEQKRACKLLIQSREVLKQAKSASRYRGSPRFCPLRVLSVMVSE